MTWRRTRRPWSASGAKRAIACKLSVSGITGLPQSRACENDQSKVAINPNTVSKAYRELEYEGLAAAKPGVGTFVTKTLSDAAVAAHQQLSQDLLLWYRNARRAGLDSETIDAIFQQTVRSAIQEEAV